MNIDYWFKLKKLKSYSKIKDNKLKEEKDAIESKPPAATSIKTNYSKRTKTKRKVRSDEMKDFIVDNADENIDDDFSDYESNEADSLSGNTKSVKKIRKCKIWLYIFNSK